MRGGGAGVVVVVVVVAGRRKTEGFCLEVHHKGPCDAKVCGGIVCGGDLLDLGIGIRV